MEAQMRTTFIPKQSSIPVPPSVSVGGSGGGSVRMRRSVSIISVLAMIAFFAGIISVGGSYLYKKTLEGRMVQMQEQLVAAQKQFEPAFLQELHDLDRKLTYANNVLRDHRSVAPFFQVLGEHTLKSIQYDDFRYDFTEGQGVVQIIGQARSYRAIAQQSEAFSKERLIREHVFSDFALQDNGRVRFQLAITLSPELLMFEKSFPLFNQAENTLDTMNSINSTTNNSMGTTTLPILPS